MKKYEMILKMLDDKYERIKRNESIAYSEKPYVMYIMIKEMEKNYKSSDDLLMFHQALRNWMCEHVAVI